MRAYIIRRLLAMIPVVFGVVTIVFLIIHLTPGDPVEIMLGETAAPALKEELREELGLNKPLLEQYFIFIARLFKGDLGKSIYTRKPVAQSIRERYGATAELALSSMLLAILIAVPLGVIAAYKKNTMVDQGAMAASLLGVSMPSFWIGPLLILLFAIELQWLPASGKDGIESLVLPSVTLGAAMAAILSRLTRSTMIESLNEDYIITAKAKGLSERATLFKHALANALLPVVTVAGLQLGALLGGAIITETIFAWPGIGRLTIQAINARDYPLTQGCVLTIALSYVFINLIVDILYSVIDPRIKYR
ncbi:Dipeptide transport system permease protein DppB (TC 3.A.1.5.2) [hydrothermal vent metagenome]|uniref:Dipeptide transport system permease protein DppB (TC 3.A.1.5.2) n=1 Tax=hydrothermal vent metagenome TaxID=652676 RepID=A0A3B1CP89_9ZZZZ